jgi:sulfur-oxidizing protein SoxY
MKRRAFLLTVLALPALSRAEGKETQEAISKVIGHSKVSKGRVTLELPQLVENGNTVSMAVRVDSPMTEADHVKAIHVFTEKNPQPYVATFHLGPRAGRALVSTRIRLADSQTVTAIAQMSDGSFWSQEVNVIVTLAACTEVI